MHLVGLQQLDEPAADAFGILGMGTWSAAASRAIRAQWRSKANGTPSAIFSVVNTPHPESKPTCPQERTASEATWIRSL